MTKAKHGINLLFMIFWLSFAFRKRYSDVKLIDITKGRLCQ